MRAAPLLLLPLALWGCRTVPGRPPVAEEGATPWAYLQATHDRDGDGLVAPAEYDRGAESFARLDRDGDGALTPADFERAGRMDLFVAQMTIMRAFQTDDDREALTLAELQAAYPAHDADGDGRLTQEELARALGGVTGEGGAPAMPEGMNAWTSLLAACDRGRDGTLSLAELEAFFHERDDGDGVWKPPAREAAERPVTGPAPGTPAPDFTLRDPEGRNPTRLSSFAGKRPVALIFGSYT